MMEAGHYKSRKAPPKYSKYQIAEWRKKIKAGMKNGELAKELGISARRLSNILSKDAYNV